MFNANQRKYGETTEQVVEQLDKSKWNLDLSALILSLNSENFARVRDEIINLIGQQDRLKLSSFIYHVLSYASTRVFDLQLYAKLVSEIIGPMSKPRYPKTRRLISLILSSSIFYRSQAALVAYILLSDSFDDIHALRILSSFASDSLCDNPTMVSIVNASTLVCLLIPRLSGKRQIVWQQIATKSYHLAKNYPSPNSIFLASTFRQKFDANTKTPPRFYRIFSADDIASLQSLADAPDFNPNQKYYCDVEDTSSYLEFIPSIVSAAAYFGAAKCAKFLIEKGADRSAVDEAGRTFAFFAGINGGSEMSSLVPNELRNQYFEGAIRAGRNSILSDLPSGNVFTKGCSALHIAAMSNNWELLQSLLNSGADVTSQTDFGDLPIHSAGRYGSSDSMIVLSKAKGFNAMAQNLAQKDCFELNTSNVISGFSYCLANLNKDVKQKSLPKFSPSPFGSYRFGGPFSPPSSLFEVEEEDDE